MSSGDKSGSHLPTDADSAKGNQASEVSNLSKIAW
jgi:hypothetical protein